MDEVATKLDDVLTTLPLAVADPDLTDRLFGQVVDLLVEGVVADLRQRLDDGSLTPRAYATELATFAGQARAVGLLQH